MNHLRRPQAARLERAQGIPILRLLSDQDRAPISFAWWARTPTDRESKYFHSETLYRLDRRVVGDDQVHLVKSSFFGMSEGSARVYFAGRGRLLPDLPPGYRWIGPTLIEDVDGQPRVVSPALSVKLQRAASIARAILSDRMRRSASA